MTLLKVFSSGSKVGRESSLVILLMFVILRGDCEMDDRKRGGRKGDVSCKMMVIGRVRLIQKCCLC